MLLCFLFHTIMCFRVCVCVRERVQVSKCASVGFPYVNFTCSRNVSWIIKLPFCLSYCDILSEQESLKNAAKAKSLSVDCFFFSHSLGFALFSVVIVFFSLFFFVSYCIRVLENQLEWNNNNAQITPNMGESDEKNWRPKKTKVLCVCARDHFIRKYGVESTCTHTHTRNKMMTPKAKE